MTITLLAPDGVAVTAQQERQAKAAQHGGGAGRPLGGRSGFRPDTSPSILTATSTTWTLGPCAAMIDPGASTAQGMYGWASDANISGSITPADSTYDRKDIVYIQVNDSTAGDGSGTVSANVLYAAGPADGTLSPPALTGSRARSFLVGTITVPKAGGGSPTVVLNTARYAAAGAILQVFSKAERDALSGFDGLTVRRMDISFRPLEYYDGSAWKRHITPRVYANTAFVGSPPAADAFTDGGFQPWHQSGTFVGTTDAAGYIVIGYPVPFPNFVITPAVWNGDGAANRKAIMAVQTTPFANDLTKFYVSAVDGVTGNPLANTTLRFGWMADGG